MAGAHPELQVRTHSFPTQRTSDLLEWMAAEGDAAVQRPLRHVEESTTPADAEKSEAEPTLASNPFFTVIHPYNPLKREPEFSAAGVRLSYSLSSQIGRAHV